MAGVTKITVDQQFFGTLRPALSGINLHFQTLSDSPGFELHSAAIFSMTTCVHMIRRQQGVCLLGKHGAVF